MWHGGVSQCRLVSSSVRADSCRRHHRQQRQQGDRRMTTALRVPADQDALYTRSWNGMTRWDELSVGDGVRCSRGREHAAEYQSASATALLQSQWPLLSRLVRGLEMTNRGSRIGLLLCSHASPGYLLSVWHPFRVLLVMRLLRARVLCYPATSGD